MPVARMPKSLFEMFGGKKLKKKHPKIGAVVEGLSSPSRDDLLISSPMVGMATERGAKLISSMLKNLGKTKNLDEAGFLLQDGTMVNLNRRGGLRNPGKNFKDHGDAALDAQIDAGLEDGSDAYLDFVSNSGSIRMGGDSKNLSFMAHGDITKKQRSSILKAGSRAETVTFDGPGGSKSLVNPRVLDVRNAISEVFKKTPKRYKRMKTLKDVSVPAYYDIIHAIEFGKVK